MARKKKHTLTLEQSFEFDMIGVCSHHSDYRLAWGINDKLNLRLTKCEEDYIVVNKKGEPSSSHSMYEFIDEENRLEYFLIKNKQNGKYLIPEKPSIDFFLFLNNNLVIDIEDIVPELREVSSVIGVYPFDPEEIDSAEDLVFN
jgi:hypothetical protein